MIITGYLCKLWVVNDNCKLQLSLTIIDYLFKSCLINDNSRLLIIHTSNREPITVNYLLFK
jgi:hypothetical protein